MGFGFFLIFLSLIKAKWGFVLTILWQKHAKTRLNAHRGDSQINTEFSCICMNTSIAIFHQTWPVWQL